MINYRAAFNYTLKYAIGWEYLTVSLDDRPIKAYNRWIARIPTADLEAVLDVLVDRQISVAEDPHCLALFKNYQSLMPMAQEARKPMFYVKPADGAIGAHTSTVKRVDRDFQNLAKAIAIANRCPHPLNYRKMCKYS